MVYRELEAKNWPNLDARFGIGAGTLHSALEDAMLEPDHHRWNSHVGDRIRKSSHIVWDTLASEWCRNCLDPADLRKLVDAIQKVLSKDGERRVGRVTSRQQASNE